MPSKPKTASHDWTKARARPLDDVAAALIREPNIFDGECKFERARIADVDVLRISVSPSKERPVPQSFAVLTTDEKDGKEPFGGRTTTTAITWETVQDRCKSPGARSSEVNASQRNSFHPVDWQQSREARWDFYFPLPPGMTCLGLGERYSGTNLRGGVHTLCTTDQPHHTENADPLYKAIPFLVLAMPGEAECYGLFLDSPAPQIWDLDSGLSNTAHIKLLSRRGWQLYLFGKSTLPQLVEVFTALTGRCSVPPLWSLGHQQCRWSYPTESTIVSITQEFRQRKIPCDTIVLDIDYMDEYRVFTYSRERFPHFDTLASTLAFQQFKMITIVDPGIKKDKSYPIYKKALKRNLLCLRPDGKPFKEEVWPGTCVFPDFLKPETRKWWAENLKFYTSNGVAGIWNDMNEPAFFGWRRILPPNADELPPEKDQKFLQQAPEGPVGHLEVRNLYGLLMSQATYEGLSRLNPGRRPFVLTRSGYAGVQKYAAVWLGDNMSWWEHLKKSITMMLSMGISGVTFAGVDVGGFGGECTAELLVRWYETAIFYPFFRNHCGLGHRAQEPWAFGAVAEEKIRRLIETRYRLLPYLYQLFYEHMETGAPLLRPLHWHYPDDKHAWQTEDQFMVGSDILVAPITDRGRTWRYVYLPEGTWYSLDQDVAANNSHNAVNKPLEGGRLHEIDMPLGVVPAFVREGAIIPMYDKTIQSTEQSLDVPIVFCIYGERADGIYIEDDGETLDFQSGAYSKWALTSIKGKLATVAEHRRYQLPSARRFLARYKGRSTEISL